MSRELFRLLCRRYSRASGPIRARVREMQLRYDLPITIGHDAGDPDVNHLLRMMRNYRSGGTP